MIGERTHRAADDHQFWEDRVATLEAQLTRAVRAAKDAAFAERQAVREMNVLVDLLEIARRMERRRR